MSSSTEQRMGSEGKDESGMIEAVEAVMQGMPATRTLEPRAN